MPKQMTERQRHIKLLERALAKKLVKLNALSQQCNVDREYIDQLIRENREGA